MNGEDDHEGWALLGVGGAHMDRIGHVSGAFHAGASNPGRLVTSVGGGALNALRNAVLRGAGPAALLSARGGDHDGAILAETIEAAGIGDLSAVFLDRRTASYTAILSGDGEQIAGLADMAIYETALPRQLRRKALREAIANARAILVDANLPEAALRAVAERAAGPIFAIAISPAKAPRLTAIAPRIHTVFMNRREAKALTGHDDARQCLDGLAALGFSRAVITDGSRAVLVLEGEARSAVIPPPASKVADVTGAGDALAGATLAALLKDGRSGLSDAVRSGVAAAQLTLRVESPVAQALAGADFDTIRAATAVREIETLEEEEGA